MNFTLWCTFLKYISRFRIKASNFDVVIYKTPASATHPPRSGVKTIS